MLVGYARVSTAIQNPDHQIDALTRTGVARKHIYLDHASGAKASRPKLDELIGKLRDGDTLAVMDGELITDEVVLKAGDRVKLLGTISGG